MDWINRASVWQVACVVASVIVNALSHAFGVSALSGLVRTKLIWPTLAKNLWLLLSLKARGSKVLSDEFAVVEYNPTHRAIAVWVRYFIAMVLINRLQFPAWVTNWFLQAKMILLPIVICNLHCQNTNCAAYLSYIWLVFDAKYGCGARTYCTSRRLK